MVDVDNGTIVNGFQGGNPHTGKRLGVWSVEDEGSVEGVDVRVKRGYIAKGGLLFELEAGRGGVGNFKRCEFEA